MANNDAEIDIGINLDADSFRTEYQAVLKDLATQTRKVVKDAMSNMSGAASKDWSELPFTDMHSSAAGNRVATQAFLASLSHDLKSQGYTQNSIGYQSALLNAAYYTSTPDPWQRYYQMQAAGYAQQADITGPGTALGRTIANDFALLSQPWARDFIAGTDNTYRGKPGQFIDFEQMREHAVEAGFGRWINPRKEHTADNFELINDELEKIEDNSNKSEKTFTGWNDTLKSVLGTLTAIGSLTGIAKTFEIAYNASEKGTTQAATSLPRSRAFVGMGALDVLATQVAGQSVGLGKDAVYNEIVGLSNKREEYKLLGQGLDALFPSLSGIFDNIMSGDNPYEAYKSIITELYGALRDADDDTRAQALMLLEKQGLGSASYIIGSFLSNDKLAAEMDYDPLKLFSLRENPYRSSYQRAETVLPDLTQLNESIAASYNQMYLDWELAFGKPFKDWWDKTLKNKVVPWFEKILSFVTMDENEKLAQDAATQIAIGGVAGIYERNAAIENASGAVKYAYTGHAHKAPNTTWETWLGGEIGDHVKGKAAQNQWDMFNKVLWYSDNDIAALKGTKAQQTALRTIRDRMKKMKKKLVDTQLVTFLENTTDEDIDTYLLRAIQSGIYGSAKTWEADFDTYIEKLLSTGAANSKADDAVLEVLRAIASNTEASKALLGNRDVWIQLENTWGKAYADQGRKILNR